MERDRWVFLLSVLGMLFSGYLSYSKIFLGTCPLKESCPYLFGYPVCVFGLILFITLFLSSIISLYKKKLFQKKYLLKKNKSEFKIKIKTKSAYKNTGEDVILAYFVKTVSLLGVLFSLYFAVYELASCKGCTFSLLLPTCIYGLVMYVAIFLLQKT